MSSEYLLSTATSTINHQEDALRPATSSSHSLRCGPEPALIFEELPQATIISVSRPDASDFSPLLLSYTIELQYKQFKWTILKKASQVIYLHFALRKRAIIEELHEKQEQVKEWLHHIGVGDQTAVIHDDDEPDDGAVPIHNEDGARKRYVPSRAAIPIIRPALGSQQTISDKAKVAMQAYLNHFLGDIDIVNSREVCKFLEVSKLSFLHKYGPKLKEDYIMVKHLPNIQKDDVGSRCCMCSLFCCCNNNWQKVWGVLKPGFLALLEDPFGNKLLDIIVFDVLPASSENGKSCVCLANETKERNPLRYSFQILCGNRCIRIRSTSKAKVKDWVTAVNDTGLRPAEGWCNPHRFGSFAPQRGIIEDASEAQWFIDGHVAFEAIASSIETAKSEIYITGWWICPELYLRRPFHNNDSSRLDALFEVKAKQGVKIYILLYKEVNIALKINSLYSKKRLLNIHENVKVLRYPDHISTGIYLWSHHEKIVIVDHEICFIGGLDLCFGRYDTIEHKVGDCPPYTWPGKDYYNPRESEPNSWEDTMKDEFDRGKYPRMPWHDVHCALWGPPCRDVARHFVQRWNHAKRSKALHEQAIPLLMPQQHMVLPHYMGRSKEKDIKTNIHDEGKQKDISKKDSFSSRSPSQDVPLLLPHEANGVESFSEKNLTGLSSNHHNNHYHDQPSGPSQDLLFSFDKPHDVNDSIDIRQDDLCDLQESDDTRVFSTGESSQVGHRTSCHCQIIRSVGQWSAGTSQTEDSIQSAYCSLIDTAEHFIYIENQFFISGLSGDDIIQNRVLEAIYRRIMRAHKEQKRFRIIVVIPLLPGFEGGLDDFGAATVRALMHWQYRTICRGANSILHNLNLVLGPKIEDYISFFGLRTYGRLFDGGPLVTSQVYVHSKVMIIDDRVALIGSSNINDRSLLGSRDSEIGVLIEDKEFIESSMNGEKWKAGKFAFSLRISLWSEHLGLQGQEVSGIGDPVADCTYKNLWLSTANKNAKVYQDVFSCIPNDIIRSRSALRQSMSYWKEKLGHTTIDLGVAPEKVEIVDKDGKIEVLDSAEHLKLVRGFLVSFPLEFMCEEDLRPVFVESEFYAAPQVFY